MKKIFVFMAFIALSISANAQIKLGGLSDLVKDVTNSATSAITGQGKDISSESLVGSWTYSQPAIVLESDNVLSQVGGKAATSALTSKMSKCLQSIGVKPGTLQFNFNADNTYSISISKKTFKGIWSIENTKLVLSVETFESAPIKCDSKMIGENLQIVVNTDFLLKVLGSVSNVTQGSVSTITKLAENYKGLKIGLGFTKILPSE